MGYNIGTMASLELQFDDQTTKTLSDLNTLQNEGMSIIMSLLPKAGGYTASETVDEESLCEELFFLQKRAEELRKTMTIYEC